jgi:hypothetical protein
MTLRWYQVHYKTEVHLFDRKCQITIQIHLNAVYWNGTGLIAEAKKTVSHNMTLCASVNGSTTHTTAFTTNTYISDPGKKNPVSAEIITSVLSSKAQHVTGQDMLYSWYYISKLLNNIHSKWLWFHHCTEMSYVSQAFISYTVNVYI